MADKYISQITPLGSSTTYLLKDKKAIENIIRSGTTFTATRRDGTTFTFTQQDNNTIYTFTSGTDGSFSVTPSGGSAQTISVGKPATAGTADVANSVAWGNITGKPSSFTPSAHTHYELATQGDNRNVATTPNDYVNRLVFRGLKSNSYFDSPSSDTYSYIVGLRGWCDSSGGHAHELAFNNTGIYWRSGATTSWGSWYRIYTTGNKPTKSDIGLGNVTNDAQIPKSIGTTKGDIIYWSAASTPIRLGIGSAGQVLKVSSDGIPAWSNDNNSITGVKGDAESSYRTGNVNLTPANILNTGTTAQFWRGDNGWSNELSGGQLKITNYSNTVTIGSGNANYTHFSSSADIPFYFNKSIWVDGDLYPYGTSNTRSLGSSSKRWKSLLIGTADSYGGTTKPIYWKNGVPTELSETVGATDKPVFLSSGTITESTSTIGSGIIPIYMASGQIKASTSTVGSFEKPTYLNAGTITALNPVWLLSGGTATANNEDLNAAKYKVIGNYYSDGDAKSKTILNSPFGAAASTNCLSFTLKTEASLGTGTTYLRQLWRGYNSGVEAERTSTNSGSSWSTWRTKVFKNSDATTTQGNGEQPIYIAANGQAVNTTYHLKAHVEDGSASHLAYYSAARTIDYTPNITFINGLAADVGTGKIYGLEVAGSVTGTADKLKAGEVGILQYGDAGPQLRFDSNGQKGAIIFTEYDNMSDSGGASFHFVTNQQSAGAAIRARYLTAGDNQTAGRIRIYQAGAYGDISANDKSSYGALKLTQAKGSYVGLLIGNSSDSLTIMDSGTSKGLYAQGTIGWLIYGHNTNKTVGIRTSSITSGYDIELGGTTHTSKLIHIDINSGTNLDNSRPLMIGPLTGANLAIGRNAIQARNNGEESILYLNYNAGSIQFGSSTSLTAPTKIFGTVTPGADATYDLGNTATLRWKNGFFTTSLRVGPKNTTTGSTTDKNIYIGPDGFYANSVGVTSATQSNFVLRGKGTDYAKLYIEILGVADTAGRATLALGNSTASTAADNAYGKLILYGYTTKYSSVESSADIQGHHINYLPIYNATGTSTYYGRLVGIYKGTSGGSTSGYSDVGSTTQPVYVTANGVVKSTSYALKATVNNGTENTIPYYSTSTALSSTGKITYFSYPYTDTTNGPTGAGSSSGLKITETSQGGAANLKSGNAALVSYGDSGPQIRFASGDTGVLLYHHYDAVSDGGDGSFHFLNSTGVATVMAGGFTSYSNAANDTGFRLRHKTNNISYGFMRMATIGTASAVGNGELTLGNATAEGTDGNARGSIYLYAANTHWTGILAQGNGDRTFYLPNYAGNGYFIHAGSNDAVGSSSQPVYIAANGRATKISYTLSANISAGTANQVAYYSAAGTISSRAPAWEAWTAGTTAGPKANINIANATITSAAIPSASTGASGIVTTAAQTFAGTKTFTNPETINSTGNGAAINFKFSNAASANAIYGQNWITYANNGGRFYWREWGGTADGRTAGYEQYCLPACDAGRTTTATYDIITTKNMSSLITGVKSTAAGTATNKCYILGQRAAGAGTVYIATENTSGSANKTGIYFQGSTGVLYGAAWNDYAEFRQLKENKMYATTVESGRVVYENGDDTLSMSNERLMRGCNIVSDTYGFGIGESEEAQLPVAVSGRVLAYPYEDKEEFKNHIGWPVCSGPNGTVSIMTEEEEMKYPSRIIGTISAVPDYEIWHGGADVIVDGRVWIKVK